MQIGQEVLIDGGRVRSQPRGAGAQPEDAVPPPSRHCRGGCATGVPAAEPCLVRESRRADGRAGQPRARTATEISHTHACRSRAVAAGKLTCPTVQADSWYAAVASIGAEPPTCARCNCGSRTCPSTCYPGRGNSARVSYSARSRGCAGTGGNCSTNWKHLKPKSGRRSISSTAILAGFLSLFTTLASSWIWPMAGCGTRT